MRATNNDSSGVTIKLVVSVFLSLFMLSAIAKPETFTKAEVLQAQEAWGQGIVMIGNVFTSGGDFTQAAASHIKKHYDYAKGPVLFRPTLASEIPFRDTFDSALSYFVGGDARWREDTGFAIKPWTNVRFDNHKIVTSGNRAITMGHYYFTTVDGNEVKVEYTLGFVKRGKEIKIFLQDSSLPYRPEDE